MTSENNEAQIVEEAPKGRSGMLPVFALSVVLAMVVIAGAIGAGMFYQSVKASRAELLAMKKEIAAIKEMKRTQRQRSSARSGAQGHETSNRDAYRADQCADGVRVRARKAPRSRPGNRRSRGRRVPNRPLAQRWGRRRKGEGKSPEAQVPKKVESAPKETRGAKLRPDR
jgi:hypothetical protein